MQEEFSQTHGDFTMKRFALVLLITAYGGTPARAANPDQAARLKACASEWRQLQQAGKAKGDWRAFSKECLRRTQPTVARPPAG